MRWWWNDNDSGEGEGEGSDDITMMMKKVMMKLWKRK